MRQQGSETLGTSVTARFSDIFWYTTIDPNGQPIAKLESTEYANQVLRSRTVGDGTTLWAYDVLRNEYNATRYGSINSPTQPADYFQVLLQGYGSHSKGPGSFPARLLREVYGGGFAQFKSWLISPNEQIVGNGQIAADPVAATGRTYVGTPDTRFVIFWVGAPATRSAVFEIYRDPNNPIDTLVRIYYADLSSVGTNARLVEWQMSIQPTTPAANNFIFIPPAGARSIVKTGGGNL